MLDLEIKNQLAVYIQMIEEDVLLTASLNEDALSKEMKEFLEEISSMSSKITLEFKILKRTPSFGISRPGSDIKVVFAGIPLGHEFTSFVLALLQVSGRPPKTDSHIIGQIKALQGAMDFETYVSLSCHNCPDVVQALNLMSILNPNITHTMIDGGAFRSETEEKAIMNVPAIYLNGEFFGGGRLSQEDILNKLGSKANLEIFEEKAPFDVLVIGGGPAGASAAIYAARKGIRTGIVAEQFGGQVRDTLGIENFISLQYIEGPALAASLENHVSSYEVDIMKSLRAKGLKRKEYIEVELDNGALLKSKTVILATGARWRNVGVPGEIELKNKGVAYCPHCDGPFYKDKDVAVIGGGNSGIEAAIDLAGIARKVTVLEFMPELKADAVLQTRLYSLPNITVLKNVETKEITGIDKVTGITCKDRSTGEETHISLQGVFVQIGLIPNTDWLGDKVERNQLGEILTDSHNATNIPGVFAAGDCSNTPDRKSVV